MAVQSKRRFAPEEYLALERASEAKRGYFDGEIFATGGASERHNVIVFNVAGELRAQLKGRDYRAYVNDMRVKVSATGLCCYPDVVIVCGERMFEDEQVDTLRNPTVLIEVLSPSTEQYDRGKKFEHYRTLPSLEAYVLIAQSEVQVERYERQEGGRWLLSEFKEKETAFDLSLIGCTLRLEEVYDKVEL